MFLLLNRKIFFISAAFCVIFNACGFIDLRQIKYSVYPDGYETILENYDSPVIVKFDTEMTKKEAENIFKVTSEAGAVRGDFTWIDNSLYFVPVAGWTAGIKYSCNLTGSVTSVDGRELRLKHYVPFYAVNREPQPCLESYFPEDGQSAGTNDFVLELNFSVSMDRFSAESALTIDGLSDKSFEWLNDDKTVRVQANKQLAVWTSYNWNIKDTAKSTDGVPLLKQYSGSFITDIDRSFPKVEKVYPVTYLSLSSGYSDWLPTGNPIETGMVLGDSIAIEFNKPVNESILRTLYFEPSLPGHAEMLSENKIVYIITRNPEPETLYTLIISDIKDTEGLKADGDYRISFTPDIPYLSILSFNNGSVTQENIFSGIVIPVKVNGSAGAADFSVCFSYLFDSYEKEDTVSKINLSVFFPKINPPIGLTYVNWTSGDRIYMQWEGLKAEDNKKNYYLLKIPGGKNGINAGGFYLKEDINIYLEAVNEN